MLKQNHSRSLPAITIRASDIHGRGVYATRLIKKGTRIIEYTGKRIPDHERPEDDDTSHTFYFGLDNGLVIDPRVGGNAARWINHSCEPNCEAIEKRSRVFIYAMRDIYPGEELLYDYALEIDEPITERAKKQYRCLCGNSNCRGTMVGLENGAASANGHVST